MGKPFCSLCSQWFTAQTLVPTIDHGVYYTREYLAFPLYKCFQQCQCTSQDFLLICMKLFHPFCNKPCHTHFHTTESLMPFRITGSAMSFVFTLSFFLETFPRKMNRSYHKDISCPKSIKSCVLFLYFSCFICHFR